MQPAPMLAALRRHRTTSSNPLARFLGQFDPEPASDFAILKGCRAIGGVTFFERATYDKIQPLRRTMAGVAERPVSNRPQYTYSVAEIHGIAVDVASIPAGIACTSGAAHFRVH